MDFSEIIKDRKSVRLYLSRPVSRNIIDRCLEAARVAPSACNAQPWLFIVVDKRDLIEKLSESALTGVYSMNHFAKEAPVWIVVIVERTKYIAQLAGTFRGIQYTLIDIGIACEHLVLKAHEEGLGSCYLGWFNERAIKRGLNIPLHNKIALIITLGYPKDKLAKKEKARKSIDEIRRYM